MPLVIHSDQGREFENGLMKSLCSLLGCTKTRTAPYHLESDGMIERFNRTCLMMLSMFVNDRPDNWHELLPYVMHAYRTSVHESTGYSPYHLMMGEECSLPQDVSTAELRANREQEIAPHPMGHKGQLAPRCRALDAMIKNSIMANKRLSTSLGSKTLNNTSSLGLGGTKI